MKPIIKKLLVLISEICLLAFAPVFLIKIILNNENCIMIMENILWVRIAEILLALFCIFILFPKIIDDSKKIFLKGGKHGRII